ncbi:MAG: SAF domain-containing protein [Actinobacteria bacterium]|nr:SAF domain-containing protein [Actinomycetota bacterium]
MLSLKKTPESPAPEPLTGPRTLARPPKVRRRPLLLVGTIAAVLVGGLGTAWLFTTSAASTEVVAVRAAVQRGEVIDREDLVVVKVGLDPSLDIVPASRIDQVAGQRAATDLAPGGLLASGSVTDEVLPRAGETLVGVGLAPTMLPAEPLLAGDRVRIVETPGPQGEVVTAPVVMEAVVSRVTLLEIGDTLVDVLVPSDKAAELAARAATGRVALVLEARER